MQLKAQCLKTPSMWPQSVTQSWCAQSGCPQGTVGGGSEFKLLSGSWTPIQVELRWFGPCP